MGHKTKINVKPYLLVKRMLNCLLLLWLGDALLPARASEPLLWVVDTAPPSYVFGTIHSSHPDLRALPQAVLDALDSSRTFHPELDLSPENLGALAGKLFDMAGPDLSEQLPPELWNRLRRHAVQLGILEFLLRRVPLQLSPLLLANQPSTDITQVMDVRLYNRAKERGLEIYPLETGEEQIAVFRQLSRDHAIAMLRQTIEEFEAGFPMKEKLVDVYRAGDPEAMMALVEQSFKEAGIPNMRATLLESRTRKMVDRALPYIERGGAFIAVGAAHLPGEHGLIELFRRQGFSVKRVGALETPNAKTH